MMKNLIPLLLIILMFGCAQEVELNEPEPVQITAVPTRLPNPPQTSALPPSPGFEIPVSPYAGLIAPGGQNEYALWRFDDFYNAEPNSIDWVFIGSSHSYCTFDPANFDRLGVSSFQLGMPRQLVDGTYFTLLEILRYQRPSVAVLDLYWYVLETEFDREQVETYLNVIRNGELKAAYREEMAPLYEARGIEFLSYTYTPSDTEGEFYKGRGYVYLDVTKTEESYQAIAARPPHDMKDWAPSPRQDAYLEKIIGLCKENGIQLVFTTAPVSNVYFNLIQHYGVHHDYIAGVAERHGIPYLDFHMANQASGLFADEHFFDAGHLNGRAVKLANDYFIEWYNGLNFMN
jgi:hypothetical protein